MEELQDAIEDAQYVNATLHEGPRPMKSWEKPEPEQLEEWKRKKLKENEDNEIKAFSPEWYMAQPIGFFLFAQFVKRAYKDYTRLNFLEDIILYRQSRPRHRCDKAQKIVKMYLLPKKEGIKYPNTDIMVHNIAFKTKSLSKEEMDIAIKEGIDESYSANRIGVKGPLLKKAIKRSAHMIIKESKKMHVVPECEIYDPLGEIIFEVLKRKYWVEFLSSTEHEKCMNFLWFQDREVVDEDFNILRALGRGGFGIVNGKFISY